jgi:lysyl-tRNA synthetase class 2
MAELAAKGVNPYPHKFQADMSVPHFVKSFSHVKDGERIDDKVVRVAGRIDSQRIQGQNLVFYDLISQDAKIQIMADRKCVAPALPSLLP